LLYGSQSGAVAFQLAATILGTFAIGAVSRGARRVADLV
jgi:hypothetical protein